ncbi:MAG: HD domain-containing protein [Fusobacterium perfoetens]|uniref:HD domain-containing protein n=1 Tax=Fusobacterium perfoetens TaxID=852 RepID=UPI0023EFDD1C|nr:HD domain-containing protein [Fusobacterium perfoetens]MCI6152994.1 HD domain-containing protein [Fusobacterium perfoetens]MDY3237391.1 HD domain-containing protein [Fusobacterium perfoetens]
MIEDNKRTIKFLEELLAEEKVLDLENYNDQGVKITAHTYDVFNLSINEIKKVYHNLENAKKQLDLFSVVIGIIIHDLSKGTLRKSEDNISHSQIMLKNPEYIIKETENILREIEDKIGFYLKEEVRKNIIHIVVSHHGKWGKVIPSTKEAQLVHWADMYSAKYHRINPIDVNDILKSFEKGENLIEIGKKFKCTTGVIKDRLKKSKQELKLGSTKQLLNYFKKNKKVPLGDDFFTRRIVETGKLIKSVEKEGFKKLILKNEVLSVLKDKEIFKN